MKQYRYYYLAALSLGLLSSCADDLTQNLAVENVPLSVQVMEELNRLDPLKSYKTASNMSSDFKLGGAVSVDDFAKGGNIGALAAANLDEVASKAELLYGNCVSDDGTTDFGKVVSLVDAAKKANVGVFGSALISNTNQRPKYYQSLFETRGLQIKEEKKKEREAQGGGAMIEKEVSVKKDDLTKFEGSAGHTISQGEAGEGKEGVTDSYGEMHLVGSKVDFPNYIMGYIPKMTSEGLESKNPGGWYQYFLSTGITADKNADTKYRVKFTVKAAGDCNFDVQARWSWSEDPAKISLSLKQSDDFVVVTKDFEGVKGEKFDLIVQTAAEPTFIIKEVEVLKIEQVAAPISSFVSVKADDLTKFEGSAGHTVSQGEAGEGKEGVTDSYGEMHLVGSKVDFPNYIMGYIPKMTSEGLESKNPGGWYQYFLSTGITADKNPGTKYRIKFTVKSAGDCSFDVQARWSWSEDPVKTSFSLKQSDDFVEVIKDIEGVKGEKFDLIVQTAAEPTFVIKSVEIFKEEQLQADEPDVQIVNLVENSDCEGSENGNYVIRLQGAGGDVNASFSDGGKEGKCIKIDVAAKTANAWDNQFFITVPDFKDVIDPESKVELKMDVKAAVAQKISVQTHAAPGDYVGGFGDINAETDWKTFTLKASMPKHAEKGQSYSLAFNLNDGDGVTNTFYFDNITLSIEQKIPAGEISAEEKSKILVNVIEKWVSGMMTNTAGYVKAWDVVSDPISDGAVQKDGAYGLQSTEKPNTKKAYNDVFFWQDYLGDVDYVRYAVSAARRNFKGSAGELKLFVNEYGLDTDAKKCESLVKWLGKWENDTVKIDGVGVQLHLTCSENATENETTLSNLATMFQTLAATGKLVRVSELDVVYTDNSGSVVKVSSADYAAKNCDVAIGDFYKNVIKAYLANVPSAQQYGICQWSLTDEGDSPKGLWTDKFLRKQAYSGFADGLSGN